MGDRAANCINAINLMNNLPGTHLVTISSFYRTLPEGYTKQDEFINGVVELATSLSPVSLLSYLQHVEKRLGKVKLLKWGPRTIDLDILFYEAKIIAFPFLYIPHPLCHKRIFTLLPMIEIAPSFIHPLKCLSISELFQIACNHYEQIPELCVKADELHIHLKS